MLLSTVTLSSNASVKGIFLCVVRGEDLVAHDVVDLVKGKGVVGERRFTEKARPKDQVTLIEEEAIVAAMKEAKVDLPLWSARRNVVTSGVALNHLVGVEFVVGAAVVRGVELCEPCSRLTRLTSKEFSKALIHRGGLRCEIVESGAVAVGDAIRPK